MNSLFYVDKLLLNTHKKSCVYEFLDCIIIILKFTKKTYNYFYLLFNISNIELIALKLKCY